MPVWWVGVAVAEFSLLSGFKAPLFLLIWPRDPKDHWIWDWIRLWSHSIGSLSSFHDRSYIVLYRPHGTFDHYKAISPLPGPALVPVLHVVFCWGPAFCWKLPAQLIVMATFTTPCYGSRGRSLRLLSLGMATGWIGWVRRCNVMFCHVTEVHRLMVKVSFFAAEFLSYCHTWSLTPFHFCIQNATPSSKPSNQSFYANLL